MNIEELRELYEYAETVYKKYRITVKGTAKELKELFNSKEHAPTLIGGISINPDNVCYWIEKAERALKIPAKERHLFAPDPLAGDPVCSFIMDVTDKEKRALTKLKLAYHCTDIQNEIRLESGFLTVCDGKCARYILTGTSNWEGERPTERPAERLGERSAERLGERSGERLAERLGERPKAISESYRNELAYNIRFSKEDFKHFKGECIVKVFHEGDNWETRVWSNGKEYSYIYQGSNLCYMAIVPKTAYECLLIFTDEAAERLRDMASYYNNEEHKYILKCEKGKSFASLSVETDCGVEVIEFETVSPIKESFIGEFHRLNPSILSDWDGLMWYTKRAIVLGCKERRVTTFFSIDGQLASKEIAFTIDPLNRLPKAEAIRNGKPDERLKEAPAPDDPVKAGDCIELLKVVDGLNALADILMNGLRGKPRTVGPTPEPDGASTVGHGSSGILSAIEGSRPDTVGPTGFGIVRGMLGNRLYPAIRGSPYTLTRTSENNLKRI